MTVRYLTKDEFAKWDHFVLNHPEGHRFQTTEWLAALSGTSPQVLVFEDENSQWQGGFAYTINRKAGFKRILQPPLTPYHYPIGLGLYLSNMQGKETILTNLFSKTPVVQLTPTPFQMQRPVRQEISGMLPKAPYTEVNRHPTHIFFTEDHPADDDENLLMFYSRSCRKKIRRARREGLSVTTSIEPKEAYELFTLLLNQKGKEVPLPLAEFERLHERLRPDDDLLQGVVDQKGKLHTALWVVCDNKTGYLLISGIDKSNAHHDAGRLLRHEAIKAILSSGRNFDFEGSSIPTVAALHRQFNPSRAELDTLSLVNNRGVIWGNPIMKALTGKRLY